jgi:hypothetical protein
MKVLIACEFSGIVRSAFERQGHYAMSCDLEPSELPGNHYQGDIRDVLDSDWELMIAHPPCTYLAASGARWWSERKHQQYLAIQFVKLLYYCSIPMIAIENPIGCLSTQWQKPTQIIQPWQFGHGETKATCLWLKGLPVIKPTNIVSGRRQRIHNLSPSKDRWKERSRTYTGIAEAMAQQWSGTKLRS